MLMASLELVLLDERDKTLYIVHMTFPTFFPRNAALFNGFKKMIVKLVNYHLYLIYYWNDQFVHHP